MNKNLFAFLFIINFNFVFSAADSQPIYSGFGQRPMNVVALGSGSGTNIEAIIKSQDKVNPTYLVRALFTDRESGILKLGDKYGIKVVYISYFKFMQNAKGEDARDLYYLEVIKALKDLNIEIDLIILAGYMRIVPPIFLNYYKNKVINVHPADLTVLLPDGKRKYTGADGVLKALLDGKLKTRSSVHMAIEQVDEGKILVLGPEVALDSLGRIITKEIADEHQNLQKEKSDWPALIRAIQEIAAGKITLDSPIIEMD